MKPEDIYDGVTGIRDDLVEGARAAPRQYAPKRGLWMGAVAAVLVLALLGNLTLRPGGGPLTAYAIAEAQYPEMAPYPDEEKFRKPNGETDDSYYDAYSAWRDGVQAQGRELGDLSSLEPFFARSAQTFLAGGRGENRAYSPLNLYMALAMLSELTGGESREQLLSLLGSGSVEELRRQASDIWNVSYRSDGLSTSVMANSLWLNENVDFIQRTMDILAEDYYASSYRGRMGSEEFDQALQGWLREQTGGLLEEAAESVELTADTIMALASTLYFKDKWTSEFMESFTSEETFHAPGGDRTVPFMHQGGGDAYFWGERFAAVAKNFEGGGEMWFLLPDQGVAPEELLSDGEALDFLFSGGGRWEWENQKHLTVNKAVPKFDVSSQLELAEGLQALGITDLFDPARADFSPSTGSAADGSCLSRATHAARVTIDETGCEAAAFTVIARSGASMPPEEEVDFVLDRPFLFCVTGRSGLPLFMGIVNQP